MSPEAGFLTGHPTLETKTRNHEVPNYRSQDLSPGSHLSMKTETCEVGRP